MNTFHDVSAIPARLRFEQQARLESLPRRPGMIWSGVPNVRTVATGAAQVLFIGPRSLAPALLLFASEANTVTIHVGKTGIALAPLRGISFSLAPGRSAYIYTDDLENELIDLSQLFVIHSAAVDNTLFATIYTARPL